MLLLINFVGRTCRIHSKNLLIHRFCMYVMLLNECRSYLNVTVMCKYFHAEISMLFCSFCPLLAVWSSG